MIRPCGWLGVLALVVGPVAAQPPKGEPKPPWERRLTGGDAKAAAGLRQKFADAANKDDYEAAVRFADEVVALRTRIQGADHWETVNDRVRAAAQRKVAALPAEKRREWRKAVDGSNEAHALEAKDDFANAL